MIKRRLGRTELKVSRVGCGGMFIATEAGYFPKTHEKLSFEQAVDVVEKAFKLGINYFDTAPNYGDSEKVLGTALKNVRDECILATKVGPNQRNISVIEARLKSFQTDRIDLIQMPIHNQQNLDKALSIGGGLETCKKARSKGLVDFIGITGHNPRLLASAIKTGEFDTVLVPINVVTRQALESLVPLAKKLDVGVIAMKTLGTKISNIGTWIYGESLALFSEEPDLSNFLGNDKVKRIRNCLRYVLAQDISTAIVGFGAVEQVAWAVKVAEEFNGLTPGELRHFKNPSTEQYCRDCGLCLPCPEKVNIIAVLRFLMFAEEYGLKNWAKKLYKALPSYHNMATAEACTKCGECEPKCPYKLPIVDMLTRSKETFS